MNDQGDLTLDKARIRVDFNEMVAPDLVLLSVADSKVDSDGTTVKFVEGLRVDIYQEDSNENGEPDFLVATGIVERNTAVDWSQRVRWCCRIGPAGIQHLSELAGSRGKA